VDERLGRTSDLSTACVDPSEITKSLNDQEIDEGRKKRNERLLLLLVGLVVRKKVSPGESRVRGSRLLMDLHVYISAWHSISVRSCFLLPRLRDLFFSILLMA
jgi:hypothetical protein